MREHKEAYALGGKFVTEHRVKLLGIGTIQRRRIDAPQRHETLLARGGEAAAAIEREIEAYRKKQRLSGRLAAHIELATHGRKIVTKGYQFKIGLSADGYAVTHLHRIIEGVYDRLKRKNQ